MVKYLTLALFLLFACVCYAENRIYWQAVKVNPHEPTDDHYSITVRVTVPDIPFTKACYVKGPAMEDYAPAEWFQWMDAWDFRMPPMSLIELQNQSVGLWEFQLIYDDESESKYTFVIVGTIEDDNFLPVPTIIEPAQKASNVIAQDYVMRWESYDAHQYAHALALEITGEDFFHFSMLSFYDDKSLTEWRPGWLELGDAYAKIGYFLFNTQMLTQLAHVSGPAIDWDAALVFFVSGDKHDFTVKYSLDFNEDGIIDLADMAVLFSHWLEAR